ncbi:hypothetical protein BC332_29783 [Capsicum chinense]|nr:hypothetical protein BC332_29783 [Capsicum chinense]
MAPAAPPNQPDLLYGVSWASKRFLPKFDPEPQARPPNRGLRPTESCQNRCERTESFQAQCVMTTMEAYGVKKMIVVGLSYGGFVGYSMAWICGV